MQTPAENHLFQTTAAHLRGLRGGETPSILNIGAGRDAWIEKRLERSGLDFLCDRIDVEDCRVQLAGVRHCWTGGVEDMAPVGSGRYAAAFANYVLEHVAAIDRAASEIFRVLAPSGIFVASVPNPASPEFVLARHTGVWFHRMVRRAPAWETHYAYRSVPGLVAAFEGRGFATEEVRLWPFAQGYLWRYPLVNLLGKLYDRLVSSAGIDRLMGNVCVTFRKPARAEPTRGAEQA